LRCGSSQGEVAALRCLQKRYFKTAAGIVVSILAEMETAAKPAARERRLCLPLQPTRVFSITKFWTGQIVYLLHGWLGSGALAGNHVLPWTEQLRPTRWTSGGLANPAQLDTYQVRFCRLVINLWTTLLDYFLRVVVMMGGHGHPAGGNELPERVQKVTVCGSPIQAPPCHSAQAGRLPPGGKLPFTFFGAIRRVINVASRSQPGPAFP
jgi:hypothetical protein